MLKPNRLADEAIYLWLWFCELSSSRQSSGYGPQSITFAEIEAWGRLTGREARHWEVAVLKGLDSMWLSIQGMTDEEFLGGANGAELDDEQRSEAIAALLMGAEIQTKGVKLGTDKATE